LAIDVTVVAPHSDDGRQTDVRTVGCAQQDKERKKEKKYAVKIRNSPLPWKFVPFAVSSLRNMGEKARRLLRQIAPIIAERDMDGILHTSTPADHTTGRVRGDGVSGNGIDICGGASSV